MLRSNRTEKCLECGKDTHITNMWNGVCWDCIDKGIKEDIAKGEE